MTRAEIKRAVLRLPDGLADEFSRRGKKFPRSG